MAMTWAEYTLKVPYHERKKKIIPRNYLIPANFDVFFFLLRNRSFAFSHVCTIQLTRPLIGPCAAPGLVGLDPERGRR